MKELHSHKVVSSFVLWFDNLLLDRGQAYTNFSSKLTYLNDDRYEGDTFSSPLKQWVNDSSVSGAVIPTSINIDGIDTTRGTDGLKIDFNNGRILLDSGFESSIVSGSYSVKDFNIYYPQNNDLHTIFENTFQLNSRIAHPEERPVAPYDYVLPACFVLVNSDENVGFAFGGQRDTKTKIRVVAMTNNSYSLDGILSLARDSSETLIAIFDSKDIPTNEFGDLKEGYYNYKEWIARRSGEMFLESVQISKYFNASERKQNPDIKIGVMDFYLSSIRTRGV